MLSEAACDWLFLRDLVLLNHTAVALSELENELACDL